MRQREGELLASLTLAGLWMLQSLVAEDIGDEPDRSIRLIAAAEELCGSEISEPPLFREVDRAEMRRVREEESERFGMRAPPMDELASYASTTKTIYFSTEDIMSRTPAKTAVVCLDVMELCLFHEVVHAWQDAVVPWSVLISRGRKLSVSALLEGHAEFMTERYAKRENLADAWAIYSQRIRPVRALGGREPVPDLFFIYRNGRDFVSHLAGLGLLADFPGLVLNPPSERAIMFPDTFPESEEDKPVTSAERVENAVSARGLGISRGVRISHVSLKRYLGQSTTVTTGRKALLRQFAGGYRWSTSGETGSELNVTLLEFFVDECAKKMCVIASGQYRDAGYVPVTTADKELTGDPDSVSVWHHPSREGDTVLIAHVGRLSIEIRGRADDSGRERLVTAYEAVIAGTSNLNRD